MQEDDLALSACAYNHGITHRPLICAMLRFDQTDQFPNLPRGDVFHQFVSEFFADATPDLRSFQAPGKDGAIDLYSPSQGCVWECKYVAQDGWDAVQPRWAEVARHLRDNLLEHAPKQKQYQPWYDCQTPIRHYRFCTSARLSNQGQCDALAGQIRQQFQALAQHAGLAHLGDITVEICSWDYFASQLTARHALRARWFPPDLPTGYRSLRRELARARPELHQYLYHSGTLRYVPVSDALSPTAQLEALEQRIANNSQFSSVLHGRGGAGKSRLQWEIGLAAQQAGWRVWLLDAHLARPDQLAEALREPCTHPTLLLMDYIERCDSWDNWLYALQAAADQGSRVLAAMAGWNGWTPGKPPNWRCRTSSPTPCRVFCASAMACWILLRYAAACRCLRCFCACWPTSNAMPSSAPCEVRQIFAAG